MKYSQTTGLMERPRTPTSRLANAPASPLVSTSQRPETSSPSPSRKYSYRPTERASLSPVRPLIRSISVTDAQKELAEALGQEKELRQRIKLLEQENDSLLKIAARKEQDAQAVRAKADKEKLQIIELFADFVLKQNVSVEFPRPKTSLSSSLRLVGGRSRSGLSSPLRRQNGDSGNLSTGDTRKSAADESAFLIKSLLKDGARAQLPSNLRLLARAANSNL